MVRNVKHLSLHRIAGTELRVVADVESGVLPLVQIEETVIRGYVQRKIWPHRCVTLFVLQDLQPLIRQVDPELPLPLDGLAAIEQRPVVNVYDLADPSSCHVFVNRQVMEKQGYWGETAMTEGLLAHEHAHPLAENDTTRNSRKLQLRLVLDGHARILDVLRSLADKLCLIGPREVFTNELAIRSGFCAALFQLNRFNMMAAGRSVAGRHGVARQLKEQVAAGKVTAQEARVLLLVGDLSGYLELAIEVAAFFRAGQESDARKLEVVLKTRIIPSLEPEFAQAYGSLRDNYVSLRPDVDLNGMQAWATLVVNTLAQALLAKGVVLKHEWLVGTKQA